MSVQTNQVEELPLGMRMTQEFLGEAHLKEIRANIPRNDIFAKASHEYISEVCFGSYARPGLEFRDRSLMNVAMLIALNRGPELRIHIRAALHNGLTEEQICEACRHAMIYCGVPAGRDALSIASDVVSELKQREQTSGSTQVRS